MGRICLDAVLWSSDHGLVALASEFTAPKRPTTAPVADPKPAAAARSRALSSPPTGSSSALSAQESAADLVCEDEEVIESDVAQDLLEADLHMPDLGDDVACEGNFVLKLQRCNAGEQERKQAENEVAIMEKLARDEEPCRFIVNFHFAVHTDQFAYIGMEHCRGGDLFSLLEVHEYLELGEFIHYAVEIAIGIQYLHDREIIHADIKPENIGLTASGHVRLFDFGLSVSLDQEGALNPETGRTEVVTCSGTIFYSAPEILKRELHGKESDWWSYGVLMYEMLYGTLPWNSEDKQETCDLICCAPLQPPRGTIVDVEAPEWDLVQKLLVKPKSQRLGYNKGLAEIRAHELFQNVDWDLAAQEGYLAPFSM